MFSDHQWENLLPDHCDKCNRWYNAKMPHICEPDLLDPVTERNKLRRWLGEGVTLHDNL